MKPYDAVLEFVADCDSAPRPFVRKEIARLIDEFYRLPDNGAGGKLHVVLDDGNWERECVTWCRGKASEASDSAAVRMADVLLELTDDQLREWIGTGYCGHCCADYGDEHTGTVLGAIVDGRCPECGSWPSGSDALQKHYQAARPETK